MGYMIGETITYNGVLLMDHEDEGCSTDSCHWLGVEWQEGKRKFTIRNKNAGYDTEKVYDIMELYEEMTFKEERVNQDL